MGGVEESRACRAVSTLEKKVKLQLLTLLEQSGRIQTSAQTSVSQLRELLIWTKITAMVLRRSLCVWLVTCAFVRIPPLLLSLSLLRSPSPSLPGSWIKCAVSPRQSLTLPGFFNVVSHITPRTTPYFSCPLSSFTTFFLLPPQLHYHGSEPRFLAS